MKLLAIVFHCIFLCTGELQKLHDVVVYSDWSSDDPELQRLMATWATTLAAMDSTGPCAEHRFLHTLRSTLHGVANSLDHLVPDAALFLATECCRCEALRSAAMVLLKGDSEPTFPIQRAQRYYQTWPQSGHYDAAAPGAMELFRLLSRDQKPRDCQVMELLSDVVIRWTNQLPASIERAQLGIVEFDDTGTSSCLDETMKLLEGTLEESDLNPTGYMVRPGLGTESVSSLQPGSSRIHYVSTVKLPEELEIVLLILSPRDLLLNLRMMARHLSLGRTFGIFVPLSNPHFAAVDDPLAIYEYLVWHGFRLQPPGGDQIRTVGDMQLIIATPESPKEVQVLAFPGPLQPPHPRPSTPKMVFRAMEHSCITMDDLPNSWAEVSFDAVEQRIQHVAKVLRKPHLGVTLSANAFSHDQLLTGETLLSHPSVKAIFVSSIPRAIQLSSRVPRGKEVVLFSQPPMENLCQLGYSKVAILVESLQWLRMAKRQLRRCVFKTSKRRPVKIHLELDTGIGRSGLKGIFLAVHVVLKSPRMRLTGLSTKLCCSNDAAATARSLLYLRSREVLLHALLHGAGFPLFPLMLHVGGGLSLKPQQVLQALQHFPSHWLVRVGEGIFHGSQSEEDLEITWKTTVSALRFLPDGYFGYCPQDMTSCDTRPAVPKTGSWVAVLPVGFAEFRGEHVFFADGVERKVLNSGASTTVVEAMKEEVDVGDVVTLCHRCSVYSVPWSIPRVTDLARREKHCWPIVQ